MKYGTREVVHVIAHNVEIARIFQGSDKIYERPILDTEYDLISIPEYEYGITPKSRYSNNTYYLNNPLYCNKLQWKDYSSQGSTYINVRIVTDNGGYNFNSNSNMISGSTSMKSVSTLSNNTYTIDLTQFGTNPRLTYFQAQSSQYSSYYALLNMVRKEWVFRECKWKDLNVWNDYSIANHLQDFSSSNTHAGGISSVGSFDALNRPAYFRYIEWSKNSIPGVDSGFVRIHAGTNQYVISIRDNTIGYNIVGSGYNSYTPFASMEDYSTQIGNRYIMDFRRLGVSPRFISYNGHGLEQMTIQNWIFLT